jgi:hypothetical protein
LDELEGSVAVLLDAGLAPNTKRAYASGQNAWFSFCTLYGLATLLTGTSIGSRLQAEKQVMLFSAFLWKFLVPETIQNYLSGVRSLHVDLLGYVPWALGLRLKRMIAGLRRLGGRPRRKRAPVSLQLLRKWFELFDFTLERHVEAWVAILLAFFGLMRKSEFTVPAGARFHHKVHLSRGSVHFMYDSSGGLSGMKVWLAFSKTDQFGVGCWISFARVGGWCCPVSWMVRLRGFRPSASASSPMFPGFDDTGLSSVAFTNIIGRLARSIPAYAGLDLTPHSLRIGGAMALFEAGAPEPIIMMMGRWRGASWREYIRQSPPLFMAWNRVMAGASSGGGQPAPCSLSRGDSAVSCTSAVVGAVHGQARLVASALEVRNLWPCVHTTRRSPNASASEIMGQWLGGACHQLLSPWRGERTAARKAQARDMSLATGGLLSRLG